MHLMTIISCIISPKFLNDYLDRFPLQKGSSKSRSTFSFSFSAKKSKKYSRLSVDLQSDV